MTRGREDLWHALAPTRQAAAREESKAMGSIPSESLIKELQRDAYTALVRALYANPHPEDPMVIQNFLMQAAQLLSVSDPMVVYQQEQANIELIRRGQRPKGGLIAGGTPGSLPSGPIGAPGSSKRYKQTGNRASVATPKGGGSTLQRSRSTRSTGTIDPEGLVGRRIWRYYPDEDPQKPWVEGFITDWEKASNLYIILYDPNTISESTEAFDFESSDKSEYVLGDYYDITSWNGSRRIAQRPQASSVAPHSGSAAPKRRRGSIKMPAFAPFQQHWFETAIHEANRDDLDSMLSLLETREMELATAIEAEDEALALGEDAGKRYKLENDFLELCKKEEILMAELKILREGEE